MTNAKFQHPYAKHKGLTQLSANIFNCFLTSDHQWSEYFDVWIFENV